MITHFDQPFISLVQNSVCSELNDLCHTAYQVFFSHQISNLLKNFLKRSVTDEDILEISPTSRNTLQAGLTTLGARKQTQCSTSCSVLLFVHIVQQTTLHNRSGENLGSWLRAIRGGQLHFSSCLPLIPLLTGNISVALAYQSREMWQTQVHHSNIFSAFKYEQQFSVKWFLFASVMSVG